MYKRQVFNGTSDYLTVPGSSAFAFGTGDFTIEFWVRSISSGTSMNLIWMTSSWGIIVYSNSQIYYQNVVASTNVIGGVAYGNLFDGNWHHVALSRASGQSRFFIDGTPIGTATADTINYTATNTINIANVSGYGYFSGTMSNIRIVKGTSLYGVTNSFTPSTTPLTAISGTSLLTCQSNRHLDNSTNAYTVTAAGAPTVLATSPFAPSGPYGVSSVGGSMYFNGSTDYLTVPYSASLEKYTGDFTVECWFYMTNTSGTQPIISQRTTNSTYCPYLLWVSSGTLTLYMSSNNFSWDVINAQSLGTVVAGQWYHYALVRSGSAIKSYLNGAVVGAGATSSATLDATSSNILRIGATGDPTYFNGYITNARIVNGTAVYTTNFTPPTAPVTAITNTQLLVNGTNAGIYDQSTKCDLLTYGAAQISTTQSKFGGSSIAFNGSSDYLTIPWNYNIDVTNAPFTFECWVYVTGTNTYQVLVYQGVGTTSNSQYTWRIILRSMVPNFETFSGSSYVSIASSTGALSTGQWYHIAVTRNGSGGAIYVNGTQTTGSAYTAFNNSGNFTMYLGAEGSPVEYYLQGYMDEIRFTKGYNRYSASFTPPTAAFNNQ